MYCLLNYLGCFCIGVMEILLKLNTIFGNEYWLNNKVMFMSLVYHLIIDIIDAEYGIWK
ncbi:hypothetical protein BCR42DRAFT_413379 [Absidia repens]|uniref:Uncharacterized protein n=1 Tax=Absidia repens TaxID=90262 RepID=A0A1X2IHW9_9FUNG|nr:hypothetical protein BCR42DRAFT_413379 [Absidia repens]